MTMSYMQTCVVFVCLFITLPVNSYLKSDPSHMMVECPIAKHMAKLMAGHSCTASGVSSEKWLLRVCSQEMSTRIWRRHQKTWQGVGLDPTAHADLWPELVQKLLPVQSMDADEVLFVRETSPSC